MAPSAAGVEAVAPASTGSGGLKKSVQTYFPPSVSEHGLAFVIFIIIIGAWEQGSQISLQRLPEYMPILRYICNLQ